MSQTQKQRQVRFSSDDDARVEARAQAVGMSVPGWMKTVVLRALEDASTAEVVRDEIKAAHARSEKQLADLKGYLFEALVGLGDRIKASQVNFLQELVGQLPQQTQRKTDMNELFPSRPNTGTRP